MSVILIVIIHNNYINIVLYILYISPLLARKKKYKLYAIRKAIIYVQQLNICLYHRQILHFYPKYNQSIC